MTLLSDETIRSLPLPFERAQDLDGGAVVVVCVGKEADGVAEGPCGCKGDGAFGFGVHGVGGVRCVGDRLERLNGLDVKKYRIHNQMFRLELFTCHLIVDG